jgi:hypothetical protein
MSRALLDRKPETPLAPKPKAPAASSSLRIGAPDHASEREADRVADGVMRGGTKPDWSLSQVGMGMPAENSRGGPSLAPPIVHDVLDSPSQALEAKTRTFFEQRFGRDFSDVRVHESPQAAESASAVQAQAYTVGRDVVLGEDHEAGTEAGRRLLAHELVHTLQQKSSRGASLQRQAKASPETKLVDDFAAKFPAAAALIKPNPAAMKLVKEAFDAGATFGGFAEDGPDKASGRAYTVGHAVYVPKNRADPPVHAMRDFLFELNNAIRQPKFTALATAATKGSKTDTAAAKQYAHDIVEGEVEGMLRLGEVWFETKAKYLGNQAHKFDSYDKEFFLAEYQSFKDNKKTKDDIVKDVLQRTYETGTLNGKTVEQNYMEQYQSLAH